MVVNSCTIDQGQKDLLNKKHKIISTEGYSSERCGSISSYSDKSFGYDPTKEPGFDSGIQVKIKDKNANQPLDGYGWIEMRNRGSGNFGIVDGESNFECGENLQSKEVTISIFAKGYSPYVFNISLQENKLMTVEISLEKGKCAINPQCFERSNYTFSYLGLKEGEYTLLCLECDLSRGGYTKIRGRLNNGNDFTYYGSSFVSSSSAFSSTFCFKTSDKVLYNLVKENICTDDQQCKEGEFEYSDETGKTLSVVSSGARGESKSAKGKQDCMNDY